ncbi:cilia- and flagella-associated protein 91-like [Pectinophora gossypiella]|uniref:cilia- and flagella-associated protein 91-like n=1 Tax=Pectinophora gossypiella TaxID=13191 RepID=UPI00214F40BD|nr:cilia- and flagella-associated protein 91-like [Pectinophora gossypiella]
MSACAYSAYIVSGARDYARTQFKAAMGSAQVIYQPVYKTMFSELRKYPRMHVVYHPNCRMPDHMDTSYGAYLTRVGNAAYTPTPDFGGKDRFKFSACPRKVLDVKNTSPEFHPPTPQPLNIPSKPRNRGTQSVYRESSAQTIPWQPDGVAAKTCENTPEVLYLDKLEWGPGKPYRTGDLPADFHTTEIINKMRHARVWYEVAERGVFPRWMKKRDAIITDIETKDWIFREAEIDELQDIRLSLLHKLQAEKRTQQNNKNSRKLDALWRNKKKAMERKIDHIHRSRDREIRKLTALHNRGGKVGLAQQMRAARAMGSPTIAASDPTSDMYAPVARHGYQARGRHAQITYDPSLLLLEDHQELGEMPAWLEECGQNLRRSCSGHPLPRDPMKLCERETKWSEDFLEKLHEDLKKARFGAAAMSAGPLHVLKPRRLQDTPRPATPEVEAVTDSDENNHQAALLLQRIVRGRAVQCLMYEGRTRAAELTEELKTTHGLQKEDKIRIAKEEAKSRDYNAMRTEREKKEDAVTALVDELCGGAVSAALDFLEKELRRLKEERRQHAFIMIALREKQMREAAEAGRRQKEEHRRREHDEMFKQVLGVTQDTVETYLHNIIIEGVALGAEAEAVKRAEKQADDIDEQMQEYETMSTAEQHELVAELVQQFLLPAAHKAAAKHRIESIQQAKLEAARRAIFGLLDEAEIREPYCTRCGEPLDDLCRCLKCPIQQRPQETTSREDPRWKATRTRPRPRRRPLGERFPPSHEFRCMLNTLVDEVVVESRRGVRERDSVKREYDHILKENMEVELEARTIVQDALDLATGAKHLPVKERQYHHFFKMHRADAIKRTEAVHKAKCPRELPSQVRQRMQEKIDKDDGACRCFDEPDERKDYGPDPRVAAEIKGMLPSEVRVLEELRRCKCDDVPKEIPEDFGEFEDMTTTESTGWSMTQFQDDEGDPRSETDAAKSEVKPPTVEEEDDH